MKADLTNSEIDELDQLLQQAPEPLQPLDVVSLDGYLCAVAVQPRIVPPADWLARALDTDGSRWPPVGLDDAWLTRLRALMQRRYEALVRGMAEEGLMEHPEDAVHIAMSRILRHLPPETDEDRALVAELDEQVPLRDDTHAIEDTVEAAVTLWNLTAQERTAVRTIQREGAKLGRNDPCHCGSGKKFKQCHGKG